MLPLGHIGITLAITRVLQKSLALQRVDYRFILLGSILPDLIDKPLGYIFSAKHGIGGKSYGHSLLFWLLLFIISVVLERKKNRTPIWFLLIGTIAHDIADTMWHFPKIFFDPIYQWKIATPPYEAWQGFFHFRTLQIRQLFAFEIIGGSILLYFFIKLALHNKISHFIKTGELM